MTHRTEKNTTDAATPTGGGPPPKYKMVVVTTAVIYTQTLWVPKVLGELLKDANLHPDVMGLLVVFCIVSLATYVLFPIVTRLAAFWLFPAANYREKLMELVPPFLQRRHTHERTNVTTLRQPSSDSTAEVVASSENDGDLDV